MEKNNNSFIDKASIKTIDSKRIIYFVIAVLFFFLTEIGRNIYRPFIYTNNIYDYGIADSIGNSGGIIVSFSKLLVVCFTRELSKQLESKNIAVNCVHPGVVGTDVFREYPKWSAKFLNLMISKPASGAKPIIYLASSEDIADVTGKYFYKSKPKEIDKIANESELIKKIWVKTEQLTGIKYTE